MKTETLTIKEAVNIRKLLSYDDLLKLKDEDDLASEVAKHIYFILQRSKGIKGIDKKFEEKTDEYYEQIIDGNATLKEKAELLVGLLEVTNYHLDKQKKKNELKASKAAVNNKKIIKDIKTVEENKEKGAVMMGELVRGVKKRLDQWVLKGLDPDSKGSIKQRLGQKLAEKRAFVLPRIRLAEGIGTAYDVRVQKNGVNKHFDLVIEEYVDGTLKTADGDIEYGWLALNNEKSIYPVKFTLNDVDGNKLYEAVSLTKESFDFYVKDEHQRYGLYVINGLGMFAANLTKEDHLILTYLKGKKGNTKDYMYGHNAIIGRSLQMISLMDAARFDQLIPEGEL